MSEKVRALHHMPVNSRRGGPTPYAHAPDVFKLHDALREVVRVVGERMEEAQIKSWEGRSARGDHVRSRNGPEAMAGIIQGVSEVFAREDLGVSVSRENEGLPLVPLRPANSRRLRLVIDPVDGTKAFDNWKAGGDCPIPRPGSAISIAAVCPVLGEIVVSVVYCFDLGEVFSSLFLGHDGDGEPRYAAFRNGSLLDRLGGLGQGAIEGKRRVLCGNYNSQAMEEIARLELALMKKGLKGGYGGLSGSSATDIINVVRGSFCACLDVPALCGKGGSVPFLYDVQGALPVASGRGLDVIVTDSNGLALRGGNHNIYTPLAFVVARHGLEQIVIDAVRTTVCPGFLKEEAVQPAAAEGQAIA